MAKIKGRELRFRKMVIQPGGIVPWHSHDDRPALIYVAEGEIIEYASNCAAPIHHKAGEIRAETQGTAHWWKNLSDKPVVLFIGDVRARPERQAYVTAAPPPAPSHRTPRHAPGGASLRSRARWRQIIEGGYRRKRRNGWKIGAIPAYE